VAVMMVMNIICMLVTFLQYWLCSLLLDCRGGCDDGDEYYLYVGDVCSILAAQHDLGL
jgi:hypothetical protein